MSQPAPESWTVLKLLDWTKGYFQRRGVDAPRLSAEVLLAHALDCQRVMLYAQYDHKPSPDQVAQFRDMVRRAGEHEPVAYLVGRKEFYSLSFEVTADVLIPRPETEALVSEAITHLRRLDRPGRMWDACTGSGCVAVAAAHLKEDLAMLATDICPKALAVAERNVARHKLTDRIRCRQGDLLALPEDCGDMAPFDVITANPPYVAQGDEVAPCVRHEPDVALYGGEHGWAFLGLIIRDAPPCLQAGGILVLEFGLGQGDAVRDAMVATGQFAEPKVLRDPHEIERVAVATRT